MTTNKPEVVAVMYRDGSVLTKQECGIAFDSCCNVETQLIHLSDYERLQADYERLQAECERVRGMLFQCEKDRDQYERDADRYRWLRDPCSGAERVVMYGRGDYGRGLMAYTMLDEAIDAAMQGDKP